MKSWIWLKWPNLCSFFSCNCVNKFWNSNFLSRSFISASIPSCFSFSISQKFHIHWSGFGCVYSVFLLSISCLISRWLECWKLLQGDDKLTLPTTELWFSIVCNWWGTSGGQCFGSPGVSASVESSHDPGRVSWDTSKCIIVAMQFGESPHFGRKSGFLWTP